MERRTLLRADGRALHVYAREGLTIDEATQYPSSTAGPSHLRWHPLRGEWVIYAPHRQNRTFLPPPDFDPLKPAHDPAHPTEVPAGTWEVAVFDNQFPSLRTGGEDAPEEVVPTAPGDGACEVVVYMQEGTGSLGALPLDRVRLVVDVWAERYATLASRPEIHYVYIFENRGVEVGVTLNHPHGQIYAYSFVPPLPLREHQLASAHFDANGHTLLEDLIGRERADGRRIVHLGRHSVAWVPAWARYAYEVWIAPIHAVGSLAAMPDEVRDDLARTLKTVLLKYDGLWKAPFPYVMAIHQAPTDGMPHPEAHMHFEFYPPLRKPGRLKYLAGTEIGMGTFAADTLPEEKAGEIRAVEVAIE
jgi:UDPglucose--hexose-1-phosphate uridylyltransferase